MHRRAFLATVSVAGSGVLAGCSGDDGDEDGEADASGDGGSDASARIAAAIRELETNEDDLDELRGDDRPDRFDATSIEDRADAAEAELDATEGSASSDQEATIETLRATATLQRELGSYGELEVEFQNCLDTVDAYVDNDEWQRAADEIGECNETLSELNDQFDEVIAALERIDSDRLASETGIEYGDPDEELWLAADELDAVEEYLDGFERFVDGVARWQEADGAIEQEDWSRAASLFEDARAEFETSATTLRDLENDPNTPEEFRADVIDLRCPAAAFADASDEMAKGANAADEGNNAQAEDHFDAAETALQRCE